MEQIHRSTLNQPRNKSEARSWRPAPAIRASIALHVGGVAGVALEPSAWSYIAAALAGNHAVLGIAGMWPRSTLIGPNVRRLPAASAARGEVALTFDDGPDPDMTLPVLDILDRYGAKGTFFCVGVRAIAHPHIVREIVRRGHGVENHTHTHAPLFAAYGMRRLRREIEPAQEAIAAISGREPAFFRPPMGLRNPLLYPVLARLGLTHASWTRRAFDSIDRDPDTIVKRLAGKLMSGDVLALHDGAAWRVRSGAPVILSALPALLERIHARKLTAVTLAAACHS